MDISVLCIIPYYLPGIKYGGPVRAISNIVDALGDDFAFKIVTADREYGEANPYPDITPGQWRAQGKAQVLYLRPEQRRSCFNYLNVIRSIDCDVLYLNNYFATECQYILLGRWLRLIPDKPVIMAPRGSFAPDALGGKAYKKRPTLWVNIHSGMLNGITWQVTSEHEKRDVQRVIPVGKHNSQLVSAPNLPAYPPHLEDNQTVKHSGHARLAYLARIVKNKNLKYAIECLRDIEGVVEYDIYGSIEDPAYWEQCQAAIQTLPDNIRVNYQGVLHFDEVHATLNDYHALLLPTEFENYGHSIIEAMSVGCLPIISDQTPWRDLAAQTVGWDLPLQPPARFTESVQALVTMDQDTFGRWSDAARTMAFSVLESEDVDKFSRMFAEAAARH
jgi:glycosyltransferase involved in cell wall biosynthesis